MTWISDIRTAAAAALLASGVWAWPGWGQTTVPNTYDTDSYIFTGTDNSFASEVTVGRDLSDEGLTHFNFAVVEFDDLSAFSPGDAKYLRFEAELYVMTELIDGFPVFSPTTQGQATLKVVALEQGYSDYLASSDKLAWYESQIKAKPAVAAGTFSGLGTFDLDVTGAVNAWIDGSATNHGFGLILTAGTPVELGANEGGNGIVLSDTPLVTASPADLSGDGDVDDQDLGLFFSAFTGPDLSQGPLTNAAADLSGDGDVDDEDLGQAFGAFTGPLAPALVPEPASLLLLGLGGVLVGRRRHV